METAECTPMRDAEEAGEDDPGEQREPLAAALSPGLRAALAELDKLFELVRRESDPPASTDALHRWLRQQVVNDYALGLVPPRRTRPALPRLEGRRTTGLKKPRR